MGREALTAVYYRLLLDKIASKEAVFMVKGISRQVIVVHSPEPKLFEQAIFILKEDAQGVTDEQLLKEADRALHSQVPDGCRKLLRSGPVWACGGAALTGIVWLITSFL